MILLWILAILINIAFIDSLPISQLDSNSQPNVNASATISPFTGTSRMFLQIDSTSKYSSFPFQAVPFDMQGNYYPIMNLDSTNPRENVVISSLLVDLSFACYDNFKDISGQNQSLFSSLVTQPSMYYGIVRYYFDDSLASRLPCNDLNSQIRLATSLQLAGLIILAETVDSSPLNTTLDLGNLGMPVNSTNPSEGETLPSLLSPAASAISWPVDVPFLTGKGSSLPVWGLTGRVSNYMLNQLAYMKQNFTFLFPNASQFNLFGPASASINISSADSLATARLGFQLGQSNRSSTGMWEFTLILVIVLLAISFITSIAIHCHLFRLRRRNAALNAIAIVQRLEAIGENQRQTLTAEEAEKLPTKIFCRSARHEQKRAFAALAKKNSAVNAADKPTNGIEHVSSSATLTIPFSATEDASSTQTSTLASADSAMLLKPTSSNETLCPESSENYITASTAGSTHRRGSIKSTKTTKSAATYSYMSMESEKIGMCSICLEDFVDDESVVKELPCQHYFHCECIDEWLTTQRNECPLCKCKVRTCGCTLDDLTPVDLTFNYIASTPVPPSTASAAPSVNETASTAAPASSAPGRPVRYECPHERERRVVEERQLEQLLESTSANRSGDSNGGLFRIWPFSSSSSRAPEQPQLDEAPTELGTISSNVNTSEINIVRSSSETSQLAITVSNAESPKLDAEPSNLNAGAPSHTNYSTLSRNNDLERDQ